MSDLANKVSEHVTLYIRACGPVTVRGMQREIITQTPGVTAENAPALVQEFIATAMANGTIEAYDEESFDMA